MGRIDKFKILILLSPLVIIFLLSSCWTTSSNQGKDNSNSISIIVEAIQPILPIVTIAGVYYKEQKEWPHNLDEIFDLAKNEQEPLNIEKFRSLEVTKNSKGNFLVLFELNSYLTKSGLVKNMKGRFEIGMPQSDSISANVTIEKANVEIKNAENSKIVETKLIKNMQLDMDWAKQPTK
jgi:hypothetical protein